MSISAQVQTQNREKLAEPRLPRTDPRKGVIIKKQSPDLLAVLTLESEDPRHDHALSRQLMPSCRSSITLNDCPVSGMPRSSVPRTTPCGWSWIPVRMAQLNLMPG